MLKRIIFAVFIIINCIAIFCFSSQNSEKSSKTSGVVVEKVVTTISNVNKKVKKESLRDKVTFYVRKSAHFTIYTSLGVWLMCEACTFDISKKKGTLICGILGGLYAISDEFHQSFISGRSEELRDILIDTSGVLFGCLLAIWAIKIIYNIKHKAEGKI